MAKDSKGRTIKDFAVVESGGYIGGSNADLLYGMKVLEFFDTKEEAKTDATRRRKSLTAADRKYYKMGYRVVRIPAYMKKGE